MTMKMPSHHIRKQGIELEFEEMDAGVGVQDKIGDGFYTRFQPQMSMIFDEICGERTLKFDKIEIDCGVLSAENWEEEWVDLALEKLKEHLRKLPNEVTEERNIIIESRKIFFYFLKEGHLPWNSTIRQVSELEKLMIMDDTFVDEIKRCVGESNRREEMILRMVSSYSPMFVQKIIDSITRGRFLEWNQVEHLIKDLKDGRAHGKKPSSEVGAEKQHDEKAVSELVINAFLQPEKIAVEYFMEHFYLLAGQKSKEKSKSVEEGKPEIFYQKKKNQEAASKQNEEDKNEIYLENSGLVLLHPFLPQLFESCGLTAENEWKNELSRDCAVKLLHCLAVGDDEHEENHYTLNKVLCGMEPEDVASDTGELSDEMLKECNELLISVITHWKQLKNTGTASFRREFLLRHGKLSKVDDGWLLQVEKKGVDVLLNYLPWSIGVIRLPWMKKLVYVEWN